MNEQMTGNGAQQLLQLEQQMFVPMEITYIFRKFEGYIQSSVGSVSVPVGSLAAGQLAGWQTKTFHIFVQNF